MKHKPIEILPLFPKFCSTIGELPTSYLMSMTYLEQVTWICHAINTKIIPVINENGELTNQLIKELDTFFETITKEVKEIKDYVDEYLTDIDEIKEAIIIINDTLQRLENAIQDNANEIRLVRLELIDMINDNFSVLKSYVDVQDGILQDEIENIQVGEIEIYNPTNGLLQPLQTVINDLYSISNKDGLTATEFDALELTATGFDAYQITAYEFDSQGKVILV